MKLLIPKVCWDSVFPWAFCPHIQQDSWLMCSSSSPQVWRANFVDVAKREWLIEEELLLPTHPPWQWLAKDGLKERKHYWETLLRLWWSRVCPTLWIILAWSTKELRKGTKSNLFLRFINFLFRPQINNYHSVLCPKCWLALNYHLLAKQTEGSLCQENTFVQMVASLLDYGTKLTDRVGRCRWGSRAVEIWLGLCLCIQPPFLSIPPKENQGKRNYLSIHEA